MSRKAISEPSHSLDRERGIVGVLVGKRSGQVNNIDWQTLLSGKKALPDRDPADVGVEAPRNSLESSPGTRTPRFSGVRRDDIPYGVEIPKPAIMQCKAGEFVKKSASVPEVLPIKTLIAQDSSNAEHDKKRRSTPSVVARLMGLDAIPEKLSKGSALKPPKPSHGSKKDAKLHSARAESSSRPASPLHDMDTIKDFPLPRGRPRTDSDAFEEERAKVDILPFRAHPQERQLQEFKKEFMEQLAHNQRCGPPAGPPAAGPAAASATADADVKDRRRLLREKLREAKVALVRGVDDSRRLSTAQERLLESKEFQDAIELLQTNKEFFRKFFPEANSESFGSNNKDPPEPESTSRRSFHLEDLMCREPMRCDDTSRRSFHGGDFARDWRKTNLMEDPSKGSSRRSFHMDDLSRDSRKSFHHPHESPKDSSGRRSFRIDYSSSRDSRRSPHYMDDVAKDIRALEDFSDSRHGEFLTDSRGHSSSETVKRHRSPAGANPLAEKAVMFPKLSSKVGRTPRDSPSWASPDNAVGRHGSPNNFESRKTCDSPSRIVVLKPGPGEITLLTPTGDAGCSPNSYRLVRDSQGSLFEAREVLLIDPKERFSPPRKEEPRYPGEEYKERFSPPRKEEPRYPREEYKERFSPPRKEEPRYSRDEYRDPRLDPRAIARDIVREARTNSTRELSRDRETGRESPGRGGSHRNSGSTGGKKCYLPKYGHGVMDGGEEIMPEADETMGSFTLAALARRHAIEEKSRSMSPTLPRPSQRSPSRDPAPPSDRPSHRERRTGRSSEKPRAVYHVEHIEEQQYRKGLTEVRRTFGEGHERNRAPAVSRPGKYLAGSKGYSKVNADDWRGADANMYSTSAGVDKILKSESMYVANQHQNQNGDESLEKSPRTMLWSRSIPNAVTPMARARSRDVASRSNGGRSMMPERKEEISDFVYLDEKRAEGRQALSQSRKTVTGSDPSTLAPSGQHQCRSSDQSSGAVQDVHIDNSRVSASAAPSDYVSLPSRSLPKKAVPTECATKRGARGCDHPLVDALCQRSSQATDGTINRAELTTEKTGKLAEHEQLEVPLDKKQEAKGSKDWSIATGPVENGDGDGASETSVDKCGQPSPVSVLDSPFEAEIASPKELKELSSDIHDLRLRLRLLKLDGSEKALALLDNSSGKDKPDVQNVLVRHTENSVDSTDSASSSITSTTFSIYRDLESHTPQSQGLCLQAGEFDIEGLSCPEGRQEELVYVRNVLVASGFTEGSDAMIGRWHSPTCALDPGLYERLEDYYVDADLQVALGHDSHNLCMDGRQDCFQRRLLFDVVNEVLLQLLGPYMRYQPWVRTTKPLLRPMPGNHELLGAIWSQVCRLFSPRGVQDFEALDYIMGQDVSKDSPWTESHSFFEQIGLELEKTIFDGLIEDTVHLFTSATTCSQKKSVELGRLVYVR